MGENVKLETLVERVRMLEGVVFAGQLGNQVGGWLAADCSCQNCGCDSRAGDNCGCNPLCSCQGHTASTLEQAINVMLGAAVRVPLDDFKKLIEFRDKIVSRKGKS